MVCAWPDEHLLRDGDEGLVLLGYGAEEGQEAPGGVGVPYLLDPVDAQGPQFC